MEDSDKIKIILDLLKNTPRGPEKKQSDQYYGYTSHDLFSLDIHTKYSAELFLNKHYHNKIYVPLTGSAAGVHKRRINRLWSRIEPAVKDAQTTGGPGIYLVSTGKFYGTIHMGHVYADSLKSAYSVAEVSFTYALKEIQKADASCKKLYVRYVSAATPEKISVLNQALEREILKEKSQIESVVSSADKNLRLLEIRLNCMKIVEENMK